MPVGTVGTCGVSPFENTLLCPHSSHILRTASRYDAKDCSRIPCVLRCKSTLLGFPHLEALGQDTDEEGNSVRMWSHTHPGKCGGRGVLNLLSWWWWHVWPQECFVLTVGNGNGGVSIGYFPIGGWPLFPCALLLAT